jgi:hypothetical protein
MRAGGTSERLMVAITHLQRAQQYDPSDVHRAQEDFLDIRNCGVCVNPLGSAKLSVK